MRYRREVVQWKDTDLMEMRSSEVRGRCSTHRTPPFGRLWEIVLVVGCVAWTNAAGVQFTHFPLFAPEQPDAAFAVVCFFAQPHIQRDRTREIWPTNRGMKHWYLALLSAERRSGRRKVRVALLRLPTTSRFLSFFFDVDCLPPIRRCTFTRTGCARTMRYVGMETEGRFKESRAYVWPGAMRVDLSSYDPVYAFVQIDDAYVSPRMRRAAATLPRLPT